ncbi:NAD-dependent epimerase/dehydratase family protein [Wukongibacter sp. M2B1]|uniref:NAD-dependent epimerase/dehydratase family protein n=1 Tax=Wukongibacter sp. M2B1 TaxID=3088895 RepID=UPI003D78D375
MKKKILITGSNGFIGRSLIEGLDKNQYDIYTLDFQKELHRELDGIKDYFSIDISKPFDLNEDFDVVIHLAALNQTNINSDFPYKKFKEINVNGTKNVVESCCFKKFILFSTANVYEKAGSEIDENSQLKPVSFYERSKYEAELISKEYVDNEKLVILRPVNITGTKQKNKAILPFFFFKASRNETIEVFAPKNRRIQLLSVRDLIRAIETLICNSHIYGIFNLSNKDSIEVKGLADKIVTSCNSHSSIICTNNNLECYSEVNSDKAKQLLNWVAKDSINTIINDYKDFFYKNK